MMDNAILPLNVTALRVNINDQTNLVPKFKGRVAAFQNMPHTSSDKVASTGREIVVPIESEDSSSDSLNAGIHLHWELPDIYRRGTQPAEGGDIVFPHAPNRWLVVRYLSVFDSNTGAYGEVTSKSWIIESDFVSPNQQIESDGTVRPTVPVPLPVRPAPGNQPYMFMGRVVESDQWNPNDTSAKYLSDFKGEDGEPLHLTSIGFVGPAFCSFYPECCSVFGFWDRFADNPEVAKAIQQGTDTKFKASYQVFGWNHDPATDPLDGIDELVAKQYDDYVAACKREKVAVKRTPAEQFESVVKHRLKWDFNTKDIPFTLNSDNTLKSITTPQRTLCGGVIQEVVWDLKQSGGMFLNNPTNGTDGNAIWTDTVEAAVGNTTVEGLSALIKRDVNASADDEDLTKNYECLLDALQLGMLHDLEATGNWLVKLEEAIHSKSFAQVDGGYLWVIEGAQPELESDDDVGPEDQITLPLEVAEHLHLLNAAQKTYDQGRNALIAMRKQLFMDWYQWVNAFVSNEPLPEIDTDDLGSFIFNSNSEQSELQAVIDEGKKTGILFYQQDKETNQITGVQQPTELTSLAGEVWKQLQAVESSIAEFTDWQLRAAPAEPFYLPNDPVLVMEGDRLEPVRRNGTGPTTTLRLDSELISVIDFSFKGSAFKVSASDLGGGPDIGSNIPLSTSINNLLAEAKLLTPMLAAGVAGSLKSQGGNDNPASQNTPDFILALNAAQGGLSPLEDGFPSKGFYALVHDPSVSPTGNPTTEVDTPLKLSVTLTNSTDNGWAPSSVAWTSQTALTSFGPNRLDPFMPVFLIWKVRLDPMVRQSQPNYAASNLTDFFELDETSPVDYDYKMNGDKSVAFTTDNVVEYSRSVVLSRQPTRSLTAQIDAYLRSYPQDAADDSLTTAKATYENRKIMSQGLSGFNTEQTLRSYIARVPVEDLVKGGRDPITSPINDAATSNHLDDWYDFGFNSQVPIPFGRLAQRNFGPMRSGFAQILELEIVDLFGQRMQLKAGTRADGALEVEPSTSFLPAAADQANKGKIYLPPRVLAPSRLWFKWLSAMHNNNVTGINSDFVEMNSHPSTSPVFGWVLPNHLDDSLFFYDADGTAIGSFGIEHGTLKYQTRAGNMNNMKGKLEVDIGPNDGSSLVNVHVHNFMWYIKSKNAAFLTDLMSSIEDSEQFINPAHFSQDIALAVLIGRPLALTRAVLGMESSGNVLPVNQANVDGDRAFPDDIKNERFKYEDRQQSNTAALRDVKFPIRMGNLANIDDGLVGYLLEASGDKPYDTFFSPSAPTTGQNGVVQPTAQTVELSLNADPVFMTMLIDPRAPIHATSGILPVSELRIPLDQFGEAMNSLAVTFSTHPILRPSHPQFSVPLPEEPGFEWSWVSAGETDQPSLGPNEGNEFAKFGYTPQTVLEGWLRLDPATKQMDKPTE